MVCTNWSHRDGVAAAPSAARRSPRGNSSVSASSCQQRWSSPPATLAAHPPGTRRTKVGGKTESLLGDVQKTSFNLLFDPLLSVLSHSKMREMIFPAILTGIGNIYYGF